MRILLITENVTIQKLFKLSAEKRGDEVEVGSKDFLPEGEFDLVFIDNDVFDEELFENLKSIYPHAKFVLIISKHEGKTPGFDYYLTKPFLPTDLMELINKINTDEKEEFDEEFDINGLNDMEVGEDEEIGDIEDIFIDDEELEVESLDEDLDEDFELNADDLLKEESFEAQEQEFVEENNLNEQIKTEDVIEEKGAPEELRIKEEVDEDIVFSHESFEQTSPLEENDDIDELEEIAEKELAEALGEEVESAEEKKDIHKEPEISQPQERKNKECEPTIEEKTLGNILNINWEELKKAKAKVTITIDFGG